MSVCVCVLFHIMYKSTAGQYEEQTNTDLALSSFEQRGRAHVRGKNDFRGQGGTIRGRNQGNVQGGSSILTGL